MKTYLSILFACFTLGLFSLQSCKVTQHSTSKEVTQLAEISCGQCQLGLEGQGCDLAVRIDNKAYYVDGSGIDDHGDAHAADGMCNTVRKAEVKGKIINNRYKAESIKILPAEK